MGKTGLQLSTLSFGSWVTFHKQIDDKIADELMGISYDQGINFFDNAEVYAAGESEKMMGRVLSKKKLGPNFHCTFFESLFWMERQGKQAQSNWLKQKAFNRSLS
jgi:predicted aldo/keto reductase-like oxidoreductase